VSESTTAQGDPQLRAALDEANIPTLLLVLTHLTGDDRWLREPYRPRRGKVLDDNDSAGLPPGLQQEVRDAAEEAILASEATGRTLPDLTPERVAEMLGVALVEEISEEYGPLLAEELGVLSRDVEIDGAAKDELSVVIIGAGLSGLSLAIKLKAAGVPYRILEKNSEIGGTWFENTYPGCGVDTPSHLYSFSFAPNAEWSRFFAKRPEVFGYLERLAEQYDVREGIEFGVEVERADYDADSRRWVVRARGQSGDVEVITTPVLVSAVGMVNRPSVPPIEGLSDFDGPRMHTADWDASVEIAGKTIGVIGTGASAMQLVPAIADEAEKVVVFQRSKQWAIPHPNYHRDVPESVRYLMRRVPAYIRWYRLRSFWNFSDRLHESLQIDPSWPHQERSINAQNERHRVFLTNYIKDQLSDREDLWDACIPDYPPYGKRPLLDNNWFATIKRPDVELVTASVERVEGRKVVTANGDVRDVDVLVLATGFKTLQFLWPMEIRGKSGRTLAEQWGHHDARAYMGVTVPDFPNFFILNGPNTNAGHGGSAIIADEFQVRYIMQALAMLASGDTATVEVRREVFEDYNTELDEALSRAIWSHEGMTTYYRNEKGRIVVTGPWTYLDWWNRMRELDADDYTLTQRESGAVT
jgi:4-hydroxyacetophenone monooxygenase